MNFNKKKILGMVLLIIGLIAISYIVMSIWGVADDATKSFMIYLGICIGGATGIIVGLGLLGSKETKGY